MGFKNEGLNMHHCLAYDHHHTCFSNSCEGIWHHFSIISQDFWFLVFSIVLQNVGTFTKLFLEDLILSTFRAQKTNIRKLQDSPLAIKLTRLPEFSKKTSIRNSTNSKRVRCVERTTLHKETWTAGDGRCPKRHY